MKASVKLRFHNSKKQKMMVERRLQVTKKKTGTGLTMKTLEGTISFSEDQDIDAKVSRLVVSLGFKLSYIRLATKNSFH